MQATIKTIEKSKFQYTVESVVSADGTVIHYRRLGQGPGIVLLHGSMESAGSHMALANAMANEFTVYLPERRGHHVGGSRNYSIKKEVEDLNALLVKTDTHFVFGVSSGGLICMKAALDLPNISKIAVYEPALIINHSIRMDFLSSYEREMAAGDIAGALVTAMDGARLAPPFVNFIPRWLIKSLTRMAIKNEDKKAKPGDITMSMLAPTLYYDFQLISEMAETLHTFNRIKADVLLLGGSKSPAWLKVALDPIEKELRSVDRVDFVGLDHGGSSDISSTNKGGDPKRVADVMLRFFTA
jgi:pimeloyl-ACP methyl ester carboxylesterase